MFAALLLAVPYGDNISLKEPLLGIERRKANGNEDLMSLKKPWLKLQRTYKRSYRKSDALQESREFVKNSTLCA